MYQYCINFHVCIPLTFFIKWIIIIIIIKVLWKIFDYTCEYTRYTNFDYILTKRKCFRLISTVGNAWFTQNIIIIYAIVNIGIVKGVFYGVTYCWRVNCSKPRAAPRGGALRLWPFPRLSNILIYNKKMEGWSLLFKTFY